MAEVGLDHQRRPGLVEAYNHVGWHGLAKLHHALEVLQVEGHVGGLPGDRRESCQEKLERTLHRREGSWATRLDELQGM